MLCPACKSEIAPGQTFCAVCRARASSPAPEERSDRHERLYLILACLLAAGPLALPRLRRSKAFGPRGKAVLATLAVIQTMLVVLVLVGLAVKGPDLFLQYVRYIQRQRRGY